MESEEHTDELQQIQRDKVESDFRRRAELKYRVRRLETIVSLLKEINSERRTNEP